MTHAPLRTLLVALAALACAGPAFGETVVEDFEGAFPSTYDAFGNGIGFTTWQDGGGELVLGTRAVAPDDDLARPGQTGTNTVMVIEHTIRQWGGFTHAFTNAAGDAWTSRDWSGATGMAFWFRGTGSRGPVQVDLFDNRNPALTGDSAERFFVRFVDDTTEWRRIEIPFGDFRRRTDFQPGGAPNDGLTLSEVWGYALGFPPGAGVSYLDDVVLTGDAGAPSDRLQVAFGRPSVDVPEGGTATMTIVLSRPSDAPVSVRWLLRGDTAREYRDFVPANELVVFAPGETERTIEITALQDGIHEGDERAVLILDGPLGADLGFQRRAVVFIRDDDAPDAALIDGFHGDLADWRPDPGVRVAARELVATSPDAVPGQDRFETVLEVVAPDGGPVVRDLPSGFDASGADALSFWFQGRGDGGEVVVTLLDDAVGPGAWALAWSDAFDGPAGASPDWSVWNAELGDGTANGIPGWGNGELQAYTDAPENVALDGEGRLVITAREASADAPLCYYGGPCRYTSARLTTQGNVEVRYGRIEARLRLPTGQGLWPAFWTLGTDLPEVGWPASGEIDIMEHIGREPSTVHGTVHGPGYSGADGIGRPYVLPGGARFADGFHDFALEWEPGALRWYVDDVPYATLTPDDLPTGAPWVFDHPHFLLLNVAVGGAWPGEPDATTVFPQTLTIEHVRVYEAVDRAERFEARFVDDVAGWRRVALPFDAFARAAEQPEGAPDDGLGRERLSGVAFAFAPGATVRLDDLRVGTGD